MPGIDQLFVPWEGDGRICLFPTELFWGPYSRVITAYFMDDVSVKNIEMVQRSWLHQVEPWQGFKAPSPLAALAPAELLSILCFQDLSSGGLLPLCWCWTQSAALWFPRTWFVGNRL